MKLFRTKSDFKRRVLSPINIGFIIVLTIFHWIGGIIYFVLLFIVVLFDSKQIVVTEEKIEKYNPILPFYMGESFNWNIVSSIRIKSSPGGYGASPFMSVMLKNGKHKNVGIGWLDDEDFENFTSAIKQCIGEDNLFINDLRH